MDATPTSLITLVNKKAVAGAENYWVKLQDEGGVVVQVVVAAEEELSR